MGCGTSISQKKPSTIEKSTAIIQSTQFKHVFPTMAKVGFIPALKPHDWTEAELVMLMEPMEWLNYTDAKYNFTLKYPSSWELRLDQGNRFANHQVGTAGLH
jgi:hypothetical protein